MITLRTFFGNVFVFVFGLASVFVFTILYYCVPQVSFFNCSL